MLTLYGFLRSGNVYKIRLLLAQLGIPHRRVEVSQITADTARADFRAINPVGKVPTVVFDDGRMLSESGAILQYLANGTQFWPQDPWHQAQVLRWMFFEQYSHEPAIAVNRTLRVARAIDGREAQVEWNHQRGVAALGMTDAHLAAPPGSAPRAIRSPTSHCTPTPMSPTRATSTWPASRTSTAGWPRSALGPTTSRCWRRPVPRRW